jgi:Tfp pilus assembly protein PilF
MTPVESSEAVPLLPGTRFGPYEISTQIGVGGMGEVYRATDTNLSRQVAIKVLPEAVASNADRLARFDREARTLAALNHPNIAAIYGVEKGAGTTALVMELVDGPTLADRVVQGPVPVDEALRIARQIAEALEAAHEQGIVHRDLKPANIKLRRDGTVKVLDFGLAKVADSDPEQARTQVSTVAGGVTREGQVIGTAAYMSPEQARGLPVDKRTDIWAFGCVLFEIVTGRAAFAGATVTDTLAAVLQHEPDWSALPRSTPGKIRELLRRCLKKDPSRRLHDIADARIEIEETRAEPVGQRGAATSWKRRGSWAAGALAAVGIAAIVLRTPQSEPKLLSTGAPASASQEANEAFELALQFQAVQNDLGRAQLALERALELDPRFAEALRYHATNHAIQILNGYSNDTSLLYRAEEELREASRIDPGLISLPAAFATVYLMQGRKELIPWDGLDRSLQQDPSIVNNYLWRGIARWLSGDLVSARQEFRTALDYRPLFGAARMFLSNALREEGDVRGAISEMEKVLEQAPENISAITSLALFYLDTGDVDRARQVLEDKRAVFAGNYLWRQARALVLAIEGKRQEATETMDEETLKFGAAAFPSTLNVAEFYAVMGDTSKALEWVERAVRNGDERTAWFRKSPRLVSLHNDARFERILASVESRRRVQPR